MEHKMLLQMDQYRFQKQGIFGKLDKFDAVKMYFTL